MIVVSKNTRCMRICIV